MPLEQTLPASDDFREPCLHSSALHYALARPPHSRFDLTCATHALSLYPAALASVSYGIVLVQVQVRIKIGVVSINFDDAQRKVQGLSPFFFYEKRPLRIFHL